MATVRIEVKRKKMDDDERGVTHTLWVQVKDGTPIKDQKDSTFAAEQFKSIIVPEDVFNRVQKGEMLVLVRENDLLENEHRAPGISKIVI
jgi:hypothetical protein